MAIPKYLSEEIVKLIYAHTSNNQNNNSGSVTIEFTDACNLDYGIQLETITPKNPELPSGPFSGIRNYYENPSGSYFEEFVINLNTPVFGGVCGDIIPLYVMQIFDMTDDSTLSMYIGNGDIEFSANEITGDGNAGAQITTRGFNANYSDSLGSTDISVSSFYGSMSKSDYLSGLNSGLEVYTKYFNLRTNDPLSATNIGLYSQDLGFGNYRISLQGDTTLPVIPQNAFIGITVDNVAELVKVSMLVPEFADAAAAQLAGYSANDVFRTGEILKIIP